MPYVVRGWLIIVVALAFQGCSPTVAPYVDGPVMSQKKIDESFQPIVNFMEIKPGVVFADVGASSGALTVMMASLMDSAVIYIQDIDNTVLKQDNLDRIVDFYSNQSKIDLRVKSEFHLAIGDPLHSNLPDATFDRIYTNATMHVFDSPDSMLVDLRKKLKSTGMLFIRDGFQDNHGAGKYCSDRTCAKPLLTIEVFLDTMKKNGFRLVKQVPDMRGCPLFGFALAD